jgi:hypothetical protein
MTTRSAIAGLRDNAGRGLLLARILGVQHQAELNQN